MAFILTSVLNNVISLLTDINVTTILVLLLLAALTVLWFDLRRPSKVPPGPPAFFPILKNLILFNEYNFLDKLRELRSRYGEIYSLKMGSKLVIVLNGYEVIKDALVKHGDVFSARPDLYILRETSQGQGIIGSEGQLWKEHRTFALTTLKTFGFGKRNLESKIMEEVEMFLNELEDTNGVPFDITHKVQISVANVINSIVFGKGFQHNDPKFIKLLNIIDDNFKAASVSGPITFLNFLRYIPGDPFRANRAKSNARHIEDFLYKLIDEHLESYDENHIRDFIDAFVKEMRSRGDSDENNTFTRVQLMKTIGDLFTAGTETTATTIRWAVLFFVHHQNVQNKMRAEMTKVIGENKYPSMEDRNNLPYCEAVITEVLRLANITPLSVPHGMSCDATFRGYHIPKDSMIIPNLDSILMDPEFFPNPEQFDPTRFIDDDGKFSNTESFIPFSTGRRVCLGESVARMELFLFLTSMVQTFRFLPEADGRLPPTDGILGITRMPNPYLCRIIKIN